MRIKRSYSFFKQIYASASITHLYDVTEFFRSLRCLFIVVANSIEYNPYAVKFEALHLYSFDVECNPWFKIAEALT